MLGRRDKASFTSELTDQGFDALSSFIQESIGVEKPLPLWMYEENKPSHHTEPKITELSGYVDDLNLTESLTHQPSHGGLSPGGQAGTDAYWVITDKSSVALTTTSTLGTAMTGGNFSLDNDVDSQRRKRTKLQELATRLRLNPNLTQSLICAIQNECLGWDGFHCMDSEVMELFQEASRIQLAHSLLEQYRNCHSSRDRQIETATLAILLPFISDFKREQTDPAGFAMNYSRIKGRMIKLGRALGSPLSVRNRELSFEQADLDMIDHFARRAAAAGCNSKDLKDEVLEKIAEVILQAKINRGIDDQRNEIQTSQYSHQTGGTIVTEGSSSQTANRDSSLAPTDGSADIRSGTSREPAEALHLIIENASGQRQFPLIETVAKYPLAKFFLSYTLSQNLYLHPDQVDSLAGVYSHLDQNDDSFLSTLKNSLPSEIFRDLIARYKNWDDIVRIIPIFIEDLLAEESKPGSRTQLATDLFDFYDKVSGRLAPLCPLVLRVRDPDPFVVKRVQCLQAIARALVARNCDPSTLSDSAIDQLAIYLNEIFEREARYAADLNPTSSKTKAASEAYRVVYR